MTGEQPSVRLEPFTPDDIYRLIGWIPNRAFLLQWAGPSYDFPLTQEQVLELLDVSNTPEAAHRVYRAVDSWSGDNIGHCELLNIDPVHRLATLGRVLVGPEPLRGRGYGAAIVRAVLAVAFDDLKLHRVGLGVFDFNTAAVVCYERAGFSHEGTLRDYRRIDGSYWNLRMMSILEDEWRGGKLRGDDH